MKKSTIELAIKIAKLKIENKKIENENKLIPDTNITGIDEIIKAKLGIGDND